MQPNARQESAQFATLLLLLDLYTFFALAAEGKHQQAIEIFREKLHFIPIDPEDVQASVAQFHLVPEEVYINLNWSNSFLIGRKMFLHYLTGTTIAARYLRPIDALNSFTSSNGSNWLTSNNDAQAICQGFDPLHSYDPLSVPSFNEFPSSSTSI